MKLSSAGLKSFDYKQFGINHGEKIAIGVIGLLLLYALWGTNWHRYEREPSELEQLADKARTTVTTEPWPKTEEQALTAGQDQVGTKVAQLMTPIDASLYRIPTPFSSPMYGEKSRISSPRWLPVEHLLASAGVVNLHLNPDAEPVKEDFVRKTKEKEPRKEHTKPKKAEKKDTKKQKPEETAAPANDEFAKRDGAGGAQANGGGPLANLARKGKRDRDMAPPSAPPLLDANGLHSGVKTNKKGQGYRFVAIRGVYPLRQQGAELAHVLNDPLMSVKQVQERFIELRNFKIERQTKKPGADAWSGPWEMVDKDSLYDMYKNEIAGYEPETVDGRLIDTAICQPFPERLVGRWGELAIHPDIKNFKLTDEDVEAQAEFERRVIQRFKEAADAKKPKTEKGGWTEWASADFRRMKRLPGIGGPEKSIEEEIRDELEDKNVDPAKIDQKLRDYVRKQAIPADYMLLFRFLDFTVEPGKTYRYRVSLTVKNPFVDKHPEEVVDPSIILGKDRETQMSEPTPPVYVPEDAKVFLARADGRVGRQTLPNMDVDLFQWFKSTGTVVNRVLRGIQIGQLIGGLKEANVLRPAEESFEQEKVPFSTNKTLIDVNPGFSLDAKLHGDILSGLIGTGGKRVPVTAPDEAVIVDENGKLKLLDNHDQEADHKETKDRLKSQNSEWEYLLKQDKDDDNARLNDTRRGTNPLEAMKKSKKDDPRHTFAKRSKN